MSTKKESPHLTKTLCALLLCAAAIAVLAVAYVVLPSYFSISYADPAQVATSTLVTEAYVPPPLDIAEYNTRLLGLARVATSSPWYDAFLQGTTTASTTTPRPLWPIKTVYPADGRAILPFNRVVAYYGNFYSKGMGILGEYPEDEVLSKLGETVAQWQAADPATPVIPAIEYIDVTAQGSPGKDGKYRLRMPDSQIDHAIDMAKKINGIVVLDIQVGLSTVEDEVPLIEKYLAMPQVHLALDPEFAMHGGTPPGRVIGTMSDEDINYAINYLSDLVKQNNLPPKILLLHRFTEDMMPFGIKRKDRARHMYVIGKTGMGKSTLLENMAIQDIRNGEGMAFIDPHGSTADRIMEYVPEHRIKDVVYFAPFDMDYPVAFNVMEDVGYDKRHLVVSGLSPHSARFGSTHGARAWSTSSNTLLALLEYEGATLLDVNRMLINKAFRKKVVDNVKDPIVKSFGSTSLPTTPTATPKTRRRLSKTKSGSLRATRSSATLWAAQVVF
jgi:hypothetical protein